MNLTITNDQSVLATVEFLDRAGNPAVDLGRVLWAIDGPEILAAVQSQDSLSATLIPAGPAGTVVVRAIAGDLTASLQLEITAGPPASITLTGRVL